MTRRAPHLLRRCRPPRGASRHSHAEVPPRAPRAAREPLARRGRGARGRESEARAGRRAPKMRVSESQSARRWPTFQGFVPAPVHRQSVGRRDAPRRTTPQPQSGHQSLPRRRQKEVAMAEARGRFGQTPSEDPPRRRPPNGAPLPGSARAASPSQAQQRPLGSESPPGAWTHAPNPNFSAAHSRRPRTWNDLQLRHLCCQAAENAERR